MVSRQIREALPNTQDVANLPLAVGEIDPNSPAAEDHGKCK